MNRGVLSALLLGCLLLPGCGGASDRTKEEGQPTPSLDSPDPAQRIKAAQQLEQKYGAAK
ncbi:MAG: hypothetical protein E6K70_26210 [Planctomycetota bacterium]|nr:MAG: hypothetical protein E6K70_26210 [Planctomycetota bacterium]